MTLISFLPLALLFGLMVTMFVHEKQQQYQPQLYTKTSSKHVEM